MANISEKEASELLHEYKPIVQRIAHSACYSSTSIDFTDLCRIGEFAVLRAIRAYDPSYGTNIRSFVARIVQQDIYNEAARFLGVFTVDHRVTGLASKVNKLHAKGKTDEEIAYLLSNSRKIDADHVRDLRLAYGRRQSSELQHEDVSEKDVVEEKTIRELLNAVIHTPAESILLEKRIMGNGSVKEVAGLLQLTPKQIYEMEYRLKDRIRRAIREITE